MTLGFRAGLVIETRSLPNLARRYPSRFYLDHSHGPMLAPGRADLHSLAALASTRAVPDRDVFYVADPISSIRARARTSASSLRLTLRKYSPATAGKLSRQPVL
jgi:hypothetical protein